VHQDLVQTAGLNELIVDLRTEGRNSMIDVDVRNVSWFC
jgi:hypothetical protein